MEKTNTKSVLIIIVSWVILALNFLALPFAITFGVGVSVFDASGVVRAKLFGLIPLVKINAAVEDAGGYCGELVIRMGKKEQRFHINANKDDDKSIMKLMQLGYIPYINIVDIGVEVEIGKRNDALFTTLALGSVRTMLYGLLAYMKSSQKLEVSERFTAVYNRDVMRAKADGIINVSIADIIFGYFLYVFGGNRRKKRLAQGGKNDCRA